VEVYARLKSWHAIENSCEDYGFAQKKHSHNLQQQQQQQSLKQTMGNSTSKRKQSKHSGAMSTASTVFSDDKYPYCSELSVDKAQTLDTKTQAPDITTRVKEIRSSLSETRVESELKEAERYAKEGNRLMMEYYIQKANKLMSKTTVSAPKENSHLMKIEEIRSSLSPQLERNFYLSKTESELNKAERGAKKGDRFTMEVYIEVAKQHMSEAKASGARKETYLKKIKEIRSSMSPQLERSYHLNRMESELEDADRHAKQGKRSLMEDCIREANYHSEKAERISQKLNLAS
jgi:hypothetical protein